MHSTTYRRMIKRIEFEQALEQRIKEAIKREETMRDHRTEQDRKVAEDYEASYLLRAFVREEL